MTDPAHPPQDRSTFANPTLCLDCGQMFVGAPECPTCKERRQSAEEGSSSGPSEGSSTSRSSVRTNPTICLDCGQEFVGTSDCPSCHGHAPGPGEEAPGSEAGDEEREVIDTPTLLGELKDLGFEIR